LNINTKAVGTILLLAMMAALLSPLLGCHKGGPSTSEEIARSCNQFQHLPLEQQQDCIKSVVRYREKQLPHVVPVAEGIQSAILNIEERDDGSVRCRLDLGRLKRLFRDVHYSDGILRFEYRGLHYQSHVLLIASECVQAIAEGNDLVIDIAANAGRKKRDFVGDAGKYGWNMIEDGRDCWVWDLMPAFPNAPIVFRGGPITRERREEIERETATMLLCPKVP